MDWFAHEVHHVTRILFVCLGNICRSPSAEAVMRGLLEREREQGGESEAIELDSAGTGGWHVGEPPDARAAQAARRRGIELQGLARQVRREDFERFDLILAMDRSNLRALQQLAPDEQARAKVRMLREFDPASDGEADLDVPDPYYGAVGGFDEVLDLLQAACAGLLSEIRSAASA
jgi:protein-tyrosine phosphatase